MNLKSNLKFFEDIWIPAIITIIIIILASSIFLFFDQDRNNDKKYKVSRDNTLKLANKFLEPSDSIVKIKFIGIIKQKVYYFIENIVTKENRTANVSLYKKNKPVEEGSCWLVEATIGAWGQENFKFIKKID